jgi:hypothetical protein
LMQWSQMALLLAAQLAQRREHLDRLAWSDSEHAAREHDLAQLRDTLEPAVRAMTAQEIAHWPTTGSEDVTSATGLVTAGVAPLNGRWALHASARGQDDTVSHTWVSCRTENLARDLAREIVARGQPEALHRLDAHIQLADQAATRHPPRPGAGAGWCGGRGPRRDGRAGPQRLAPRRCCRGLDLSGVAHPRRQTRCRRARGA